MIESTEVEMSLKKVDDGKADIVISFDGENPAITIHEEFLDMLPIDSTYRPLLAQGIGNFFAGMMEEVLKALPKHVEVATKIAQESPNFPDINPLPEPKII